MRIIRVVMMRLLTLILPFIVVLAVAAPHGASPKEVNKRQLQLQYVDPRTMMKMYRYWKSGNFWQFLGDPAASEWRWRGDYHIVVSNAAFS
jgi:hypothetical protein